MPKLSRWERVAGSLVSKPPSYKCEAKTRAGGLCQAPAMHNGRCKLHGGCSTGPLTEAGKARIRIAQRARWHVWQQAQPDCRPSLEPGMAR